jgi:hypothetical protein
MLGVGPYTGTTNEYNQNVDRTLNKLNKVCGVVKKISEK